MFDQFNYVIVYFVNIVHFHSFLFPQISFDAPFNGSIDFSKCRKIFIRGYNKAGMWSVISKEIKQCNDKALIVPNIVIDAVGEPELYLGR